jgi:hypothetical protein
MAQRPAKRSKGKQVVADENESALLHSQDVSGRM